MYSNAHATTALVCTTSVLLITKDIKKAYWIGITLAIVSHWFLDFLKEKGMTKKEAIIYDVVPGIPYFLMALFSGYFWLFMFSWLAGNLLDLIDKKMYLVIFFPKKYKPTYYFHKHKTGIQLSKKQTIASSFISTIVTVIIFLILVIWR